MNRNKQDLVWACLPKEAREQIKEFYQGEYCNRIADELFDTIFGFDNLTSDTEQEEVLMVSATKVQGFYEIARTANRNKEYAQGIADVLFSLFGDKCLTDEEPETKSKEAKETQNLSLSDKQKVDNMEEKEVGKEDNFPTKELNLCELLKGCEGEIFWNPLLGNVTVTPSVDGKLLHIHLGGFTVDIAPDGTDSDGNMALFPSKEQRNWIEWKESRKQTPKCHIHVDIAIDKADNSFEGIGMDFDFETEEEALQAAEAVRKTLDKFHSNHTKQ